MLAHSSTGGVLTEDGVVSSLTWGQLKNLILFKDLQYGQLEPVCCSGLCFTINVNPFTT